MLSINLVIPLFNEELILAENVRKILDFINVGAIHELPLREWQIVLADNASTDKTGEIAKKIIGNVRAIHELPLQIVYLFIPQKGKGRAIREGWQKFPADYYVFMDADLSTDLSALPKLIQELENGADIVIGSRYLPESKIQRSFGRKIVSRIYRGLARHWLDLPFSDLACGFKGVNQKIIDNVLPQVKNQEWFFDTELLYRAHQQGYKIKEIPVQWTETVNQKRKSKVGILRVGLKYLGELTKINRKSVIENS